MQFITAQIGNQILTGSITNLILIVAFLTCGFSTAMTVAIISPLCAMLVGVGPAFPPLVPFIALGNAALIAAWQVLRMIDKSEKASIRHKVFCVFIAIGAALVKFLTLYFGIVKLAIPLILNLNEKQTAVLSLSFSYPQIITAVIGGVIALLVVPPVRKALKKA